MEEKPNYYAVIPADVRYDNELRANEKLLYGEITALAQKTGECWASNKYFADLYNVSDTAIPKWIKDLSDKKYIEVKYETNGKQILKRIIKIGTHKCEGVLTNVREGYSQKSKDNNTSINNTSNKRNIKEKYFEIAELNDIFNEYLEVRKKLKAVNSERAIKSLLKKLSLYDDETKYKMIDQSIVHSWKDIYELKDKEPSRTKALTPSWLGKDFKQERNLTDEQKELVKRLRERNKQ